MRVTFLLPPGIKGLKPIAFLVLFKKSNRLLHIGKRLKPVNKNSFEDTHL